MSSLNQDELREEFESLYSRDFDGNLIRIEAATFKELEQTVTVSIDGEAVEVAIAVPATDSQGVLRRDSNQRLIPRRSTIYDAAAKLFGNNFGAEHQRKIPIPTLCHQEHLEPIAVCRVCSVLTVRNKRVAPRLVPACQHPLVFDNSGLDRFQMEVHTMSSKAELAVPGKRKPMVAGEYVRRSVRTLVELLASQNLHDLEAPYDRNYNNELLNLARELDVVVAQRQVPSLITSHRRRQPSTERTDHSSAVIRVDHNNCILCDRCVRSCATVRPFEVIGHTGFGAATKISFDLDQPMGQSSCVSCGECAIACPTGALTFKGTVYRDRDPWADHRPPLLPVTVPASTLERHPLFAGIPYSYLTWNEGSVGRLRLNAGEVLCRKGEHGSTAFLIESGRIEVDLCDGRTFYRTAQDGLVGEMSCLSELPRNATLTALEESQLLVIRRNMLQMLKRNQSARAMLDSFYRARALETYLRIGTLFHNLTEVQKEKCVVALREESDEVTFLKVDRDGLIVVEGQPADCLYIICDGHVSVSEQRSDSPAVIRDLLGIGRHFGEIGLMSRLSQRVADQLLPEQRGLRTGSCKAVDHVEIVRIGEGAFRRLLTAQPDLRERLVQNCLELIEKNRQTRAQPRPTLQDFAHQGLHQGQKLLVVDLDRCTRCQECVRACSDSHQGETRLVLDGERFEQFLIPLTCRSCHDPLCLDGCPVDAIHRRSSDLHRPGRSSRAIVIEDWCIGCGLCARNCPYLSIYLAEEHGEKKARLAKNCDLCESVAPSWWRPTELAKPRCVYACPHDAARRVSGYDLAKSVGLQILGPAENVETE